MNSRIRILHVINDDGKFVSNAIEMFNSIPTLQNAVGKVKRKNKLILQSTNQN